MPLCVPQTLKDNCVCVLHLQIRAVPCHKLTLSAALFLFNEILNRERESERERACRILWYIGLLVGGSLLVLRTLAR